LAAFYTQAIFFLFYKTTYINEEVNGTEPFPSGRIPWTKTKEGTKFLSLALPTVSLFILKVLSQLLKVFLPYSLSLAECVGM